MDYFTPKMCPDSMAKRVCYDDESQMTHVMRTISVPVQSKISQKNEVRTQVNNLQGTNLPPITPIKEKPSIQ